MNHVPKAPPIPGWFLKHNVKLLEDSPGVGVSKENGQLIRCVDIETGHTLFTVPYYEAWPRSPDVRRRERPREKVTPPEREQKGVNDELKANIGSAYERVKTATGAKTTLDQHFFDHRFHGSKADISRNAPIGTKSSAETDFILPEKALKSEPKQDPMSWIYLETETSARAALSLANDSRRSSSFVADRVDLSLQCPDPDSHDQMDEFVRDISRIVQADVIRLDVNDFAELTDDYVGQGRDEPGSFSTLGYEVFENLEATSLGHRSNTIRSEVEEDDDDSAEEEEEDEDGEDEHDHGQGTGSGTFASIDDLRRAIESRKNELGKALGGRVLSIGIGIPQQTGRQGSLNPQQSPSSGTSDRSDMYRDDTRLAALLDSLLDASKQKRAASPRTADASSSERRPERKRSTPKEDSDDNSKKYQQVLRYWRANPSFWLPQTAKSLVTYIGKALQDAEPSNSPFKITAEPRPLQDSLGPSEQLSRTIIHVRDLRDIYHSRLGESIVHHLARVVQKRRRSGEEIMIIGTTTQDVPGPFPVPGDHSDDFPFRTVTVPPFFNFLLSDDGDFEANLTPHFDKTLDEPSNRRILEINLRHLQSMLRRLQPHEQIDLLTTDAWSQLNLPGMHFLTERVLQLDQVQRIILMAIGLAQSHARAESVKPVHIALAGFVMTRSDRAVQSWTTFKERKQAKKFMSNFVNSTEKGSAEADTAESRIERLKKSCNAHETRLLTGVVDPKNIKTAFADVHAPVTTIDALKTLTTLSLLRPDAFKYGVLAADRLPGLLLYGPPGTGKTLLAKAVAKESKATVLEVSGAQIYEKYVGEGEKMVRAVFSLAKKLSPCVVFIDEADAILGSRSSAGNRNTHREIINQFLREWDGMDDHSVFMMVASNRPFDLDDAVLRRLPRRLLVDLPVAQDRESILGIHLKNEDLDSSVSLTKLAEQTPLYSGSDLKNVSVAAALACVREENELAVKHKENKDFKLPEKRILTSQHFDQALAEISASISEDMSSLAAIRKFDEQYGDRRGRRKKTGYGFGLMDGEVDESAARVRQAPSSPPPP